MEESPLKKFANIRKKKGTIYLVVLIIIIILITFLTAGLLTGVVLSIYGLTGRKESVIPDRPAFMMNVMFARALSLMIDYIGADNQPKSEEELVEFMFKKTNVGLVDAFSKIMYVCYVVLLYAEYSAKDNKNRSANMKEDLKKITEHDQTINYYIGDGTHKMPVLKDYQSILLENDTYDEFRDYKINPFNVLYTLKYTIFALAADLDIGDYKLLDDSVHAKIKADPKVFEGDTKIKIGDNKLKLVVSHLKAISYIPNENWDVNDIGIFIIIARRLLNETITKWDLSNVHHKIIEPVTMNDEIQKIFSSRINYEISDKNKAALYNKANEILSRELKEISKSEPEIPSKIKIEETKKKLKKESPLKLEGIEELSKQEKLEYGPKQKIKHKIYKSRT